MTPAIEVRELGRRFGDVTALDGLDLQIDAGHRVRAARPERRRQDDARAHPGDAAAPTAGSAAVLGHDVVAEPLAVRRRIGLAGQFAAVDEELTGRENLEMIGRLYRLPGAEAAPDARELLERFALVEPPSGARRRTRAACAAGSTWRPG